VLEKQLFTCLNLECFCWVSILAYPTCLGLKDFVVVVDDDDGSEQKVN